MLYFQTVQFFPAVTKDVLADQQADLEPHSLQCRTSVWMEAAADLHSAAEGSNFLSQIMQDTLAHVETQGME